jgi:hypothetical protein
MDCRWAVSIPNSAPPEARDCILKKEWRESRP